MSNYAHISKVQHLLVNFNDSKIASPSCIYRKHAHTSFAKVFSVGNRYTISLNCIMDTAESIFVPWAFLVHKKFPNLQNIMQDVSVFL